MPADVYEVVVDSQEACFVINFQNCVHCETCDIRDPARSVGWITPQRGGLN